MRGPEWAAGLFEAQGHFIRRTQRYKSSTYTYATARLKFHDDQAVRDFARIVGVGRTYQQGNEWTWEAWKREEVSRVVKLLAPWLSSRLLERATSLLEADTRTPASQTSSPLAI